MTLTVSGAVPITFAPDLIPPPDGLLHAHQNQLIRERLVDPLYAASPALRIEEDGETVTPDELTTAFANALLSPDIDPEIEDELRIVLREVAANRLEDPGLNASDLLLSQAMGRAGLPMATKTMIYSIHGDLQPAAAKLLTAPAGVARSSACDELLTALAMLSRPETLGIWVRDEKAFAQLREMIMEEARTTPLQSEVEALFAQFGRLEMAASDLTQSFRVRTTARSVSGASSGAQPYCFARMLPTLLQQALQTRPDISAGILPFSLAELLCTRTVVFVNVSAHAIAHTAAINSEWQAISRAITEPVMEVSLKKLESLTASKREEQRWENAKKTRNRKEGEIQRQEREIDMTFAAPSDARIMRDLKRFARNLPIVRCSMNAIKRRTRSFVKQSRRDPFNSNLKGTLTKKVFFQDIHVWLDNSASMTDEHHHEAMALVIRFAREMKVDIYFSSFADLPSEATILKAKNRSFASIWKDYLAIPMISGGTKFEPIWNLIDQRPELQERFNLIITDFEFTPPRQAVPHHRSIHYAPVANVNPTYLNHCLNNFVKGMAHIDPTAHLRIAGADIIHPDPLADPDDED